MYVIDTIFRSHLTGPDGLPYFRLVAYYHYVGFTMNPFPQLPSYCFTQRLCSQGEFPNLDGTRLLLLELADQLRRVGVRKEELDRAIERMWPFGDGED